MAKERKAAPSVPTNSFSVSATPADRIKTLKDFKVELLYTVPKDTQGSWVNLCADPRGRHRGAYLFASWNASFLRRSRRGR
jgi:hypothetical protein